MSDPLAVSVLIPTIGRIDRLRACLDSIAACDARAEDVVLVDQSGGGDVSTLAREFASIAVRVVPCEERGIAVGMNVGMREVANDVVLVTHDDCTVDPSWIRTAVELMRPDPEGIVTGRVLPAGGDPLAVASTKSIDAAHDFTGEVSSGALYPNNMALNRRLALELGGFDEHFKTAAEDNDFSYRWLRAGGRLRYRPELVVWHHDWRSHADLERLYVDYWRWQGVFYAKHLRRRDLTMLRFIARDLFFHGLLALAARIVYRRPRWADWRRGILRGLPAGLASGWRLFGGIGSR